MKLKALLLLLSLAVLPFRTPAPIYMKVEGVDGEVRDETHPDTIEIESFSWGMTNPSTTTGGGSGAGKVVMQDFHFTKKVDKSSPALMLNCATGRHIPKVELFLRKAGGDKPVEYYKVTLEDCIVSSYSTSGSSAGDRPAESLSLNFTKITFAYQVQKDDGSLEPPITFSYSKILVQ
jgi:type VI secretion system secreted protein Hcp